VVEETGYLVASVLDTFESDGRVIAVLDTSVNHLPEVFE
jgi:carboxynorspermidine decarboxylase